MTVMLKSVYHKNKLINMHSSRHNQCVYVSGDYPWWCTASKVNGQQDCNLFARTTKRKIEREQRRGVSEGASAGPASLCSPAVYKQAVETDWELCVLRDSETCQHVTVRVCYNHRKVTVKEPDKPLPSYVAIWPALRCCGRPQTAGAQQEVWVRNQGLVVTLRSDRGLMTLSPSGRDWGNKSWAVAVR